MITNYNFFLVDDKKYFQFIRLPVLSTLSIILAGLPTTNTKGGTPLVTTDPEPTMAYSPIVTPHIMVALAPILVFSTKVFL